MELVVYYVIYATFLLLVVCYVCNFGEFFDVFGQIIDIFKLLRIFQVTKFPASELPNFYIFDDSNRRKICRFQISHFSNSQTFKLPIVQTSSLH